MYVYSFNNPIRYTDPDGNFGFDQQLLRQWMESAANGNAPTQGEMFSQVMNGAEQQFAAGAQIVQNKLSSAMENTMSIANDAIVAGAEFMSDYGGVIAVACYASGNIGLGMIIDGVSVACDVTLAMRDYQNSNKSSVDKAMLITDLATTAASTLGSGVIADYATKGFNKIGQKEFNERLTNTLSEVIGTEFDTCIDSFMEGELE